MSIESLIALGIPKTAITLRFIRASGPGGQNINKLSTAVQLQLNLKLCNNLSTAIKARLRTLAGRRISHEDLLTLSAQRFRTQELNKRDAFARMEKLLEQACVTPKLRRATLPSRTAKRVRLEKKQRRGKQKALRHKVSVREE